MGTPVAPTARRKDDGESADRGGATRRRLVEAAAELLSTRDADEITLRDITAAADANVAAVNYHFGSKEALLREIYDQALTDRAVRYLEALEPFTVDPPADLQTLLRVTVHTDLSLMGEGQEVADSRREVLARIAARLSAPESHELRELVRNTHATADAMLFGLLTALLPHLSAQELRYRILLMHHLMVAVMTGAVADQLRAWDEGPVPAAATEKRLVSYLLGALSAPASDLG
jgi:AcrR family transcriptional regulator